jgi:hypothetical protein
MIEFSKAIVAYVSTITSDVVYSSASFVANSLVFFKTSLRAS